MYFRMPFLTHTFSWICQTKQLSYSWLVEVHWKVQGHFCEPMSCRTPCVGYTLLAMSLLFSFLEFVMCCCVVSCRTRVSVSVRATYLKVFQWAHNLSRWTCLFCCFEVIYYFWSLSFFLAIWEIYIMSSAVLSVHSAECDIRSCLNTLQFLNKKKETLNFVSQQHVSFLFSKSFLFVLCSSFGKLYWFSVGGGFSNSWSEGHVKKCFWCLEGGEYYTS